MLIPVWGAFSFATLDWLVPIQLKILPHLEPFFLTFLFFYDLGVINKVQLEHAWERAREAC